MIECKFVVTRLRGTIALGLAGLALCLLILSAGCVSTPTAVDTFPALREKWGIKVTSLRMSGNGHLIDFRYRVFDPDKAAVLGDKQYKPYLIDQVTGTRMVIPDTPKLGPLRQSATRLEAGKIYFMLFANSGRLVKSGRKVTVVIGEFRVENLTVE